MSCIGIACWHKTEVFVELRYLRIVGTKAYGSETLPSDKHQGTNKRTSNTFVSPGLSYVNPPDTTHIRISSKRITVESADRDQ